MLSVLASGRLAATPEVRTGPSGKSYTTARLLVPGEGGEVAVSLIAFGDTGEHLATIPRGVGVSLTGRCAIKTWTAKDGSTRAGLSMTCDAILHAQPPARRPPQRAQFDPDDDPDAPRRRRQRDYDEDGEV
jgi:single-stranded DNA-binding protein